MTSCNLDPKTGLVEYVPNLYFHLIIWFDFLNILDAFYNVSVFNNPEAMHKKIFNPFELNEDNQYIPWGDIY